MLLDETREICASRMAEPDLTAVAEQLTRRGLDAASCARLACSIRSTPASQAPILELKARAAVDGCSLERYLLLNAALRSLHDLAALPVPARVKELFCDEFQFLAGPGTQRLARLSAGHPRFAELCKTATLRRFPGGQFDWELGGISRSDLARMPPTSLLRAVWFAFTKLGGLAPVFFSHLNPRRKSRSLSEQEANRSYYLMAKAIELQPRVKGFAACSWFRSPAVHRVSPHLTWVSDVFLRNGGLVVQGGRADPECGVFHRSVARKRLYEQGRFAPTVGLVLWPRAAMIEWARKHPEYDAGER
jgi:hypothetical protein